MANDDGFLSRWSRRKVQQRNGLSVAEPAPALPAAPTVVAPAAAVAAPSAEPAPPAAAPAPPPPPPTLADVEALPGDAADYSRFVAQGVQPDVRHAALKKLFSDPHFNVMDGLDTYIDDYSRPDPLPPAMLRQMVQGRFLGLFQDEEQAADPATGAAAVAAHNPVPTAPVAPSVPPATPPAECQPLPHEDADLRLQPHDAAGRRGDPAGVVEVPARDD